MDKERKKLNRESVAKKTVCLFILIGIWLMVDRSRYALADGSKHTLSLYDGRYNEGPLMVGYFEIDGGIPAMCVCHEMNPPTKIGSTLVETATYSLENKGNELLRKVYYYGWKGPADIGASYIETCLAGSVANGHQDNFYGYGKAFIDRIASLPEAPKGFYVHILSDGIATNQALGYWEYHPKGKVVLEKQADKAEMIEGNTCYTLKGAVYSVYKNQDCTDKVGELTTDEKGKTNQLEVDPGTYYLKETKAPNGFVLDHQIYTVQVEKEEVAKVSVKELPVYGQIELKIFKQDEESKQGIPKGAASLEGAEFTVKYYAGYYEEENLPEEPQKTWVLKTIQEKENVAECRLDEYLPLGTLTIEETKAPEGYLLDNMYFEDEHGTVTNGKYMTQIRQDGEVVVLQGGNSYYARDHVIRGDLEFVKVESDTNRKMSGIPFQITSMSTGESIVVYTDENGYGTTVKEGQVGTLVYDTYEVKELSVEANKGYELIEPFLVTIDEDKVVVDLGTIKNEKTPIPGEPEHPKKPSTPAKPDSVRTGDQSGVRIPVVSFILSCFTMVVCVMIARITRKKEAYHNGNDNDAEDSGCTRRA